MAYKQKYNQIVTNATKQQPYFHKKDYTVLNLNANFPKKDNFLKFQANLKEISPVGNKLNLCNLASLCYRVNVKYASQQTLDFIEKVINICKDNGFEILQDGVNNFGEIDMRPISNLISYDETHEILYTNSILLDCLGIMGYVENQLYDIIDLTKNLNEVIPEDLIDSLPIETKENLGCYNMIKEMLC
jgi:hypothetical protein